MIRVAATADMHFGPDSTGTLRPRLEHLADQADLFVIAGDLTRCGSADEAKMLARELDGLSLPAFAVLGNHDYDADQEGMVRGAMEDAGVRILECEFAVLDVNGTRVGVAGAKGFAGGFAGAYATAFGEPEMKAFVRYTTEIAERLEAALEDLEADVRILLLHYAPIRETLEGERPEIYPFLGSYLFAEVADRAGVDLIFHGHAHAGSEKGVTTRGIPVRNVAQPVIRHAYNVYHVNRGDRRADAALAHSAGS